MNNLENITITSNPREDPAYKGVKNEEDSEQKPSSISDKFKAIKGIVKIPSLFNKKTQATNITSSGDDSKIENGSQNQENPQSCKEKLEEKIISSLEIERNIMAFIGLISTGCGLIVLSLFLIPAIIVSPHKFCMCFALGGLLITISFLFLKGTRSYFKSICAPNRFCITIAYLVSIILGIGFALCRKYIFSILCALYQCVALALFILTFVPGGKVGINCIKNFFTSPFTRLWASTAAQNIES